jgi:hypothetical protein
MKFMKDGPYARPADQTAARTLMLTAERDHDYETAALAALTMADFVSVNSAEGAANYETQAQVYATMYAAKVALFVSGKREN